MTEAEFTDTPSAHVNADISTDYVAITATFTRTPTAHTNADISSNEPGP